MEQIKITLNGENKTFEAPLNLYDVLEQTDMIGMLIAIAQNGTFVPKSEYETTPINAGDMIEIVAPMQGG